MDQRPQEFSPIFQFDVNQESLDPHVAPESADGNSNELVALMRQLVIGQDRQNELLEELVDQMNNAQRARNNELNQWKDANPHLAQRCYMAAEALGKVQTEFIETLAFEVNDNYESMMDGEFVLNEFIDRFGPRLAHLNGVLQLLAQLGASPQRNHPNQNRQS